MVKESGAELVGCGTVIEKGYQHGGDEIRAQGVRVESLAIIESMDAKTGNIVFRNLFRFKQVIGAFAHVIKIPFI